MTKTSRHLILCAAALFTAPRILYAATFSWLGTTNSNWNTGTNWDPGLPASAADTALAFDNTSQLTTSNDIAGGLTLNSLSLGPSSGVRTLNGNKLTFDGVSPFIVQQNTTGTGNTTLQTPIEMLQSLNITGGLDGNHQLIFGTSAVFSGAGGLTWNGGAGFINATNTYSGPTVIAGGLTGVNKNGAFGSSPNVTVQSGGALQLKATTTINKSLSLAGSGAFAQPALNGSGTGDQRWSGGITLAGDASIGASDSGRLYVDGVISGTANLSILNGSTGTNFVLLRSGNTFNGSVTASRGGLSINADSSFGPIANHVTLQDGVRVFGALSLAAGRQITAGPGGFVSEIPTIDSNIDGPGSVTANTALTLNGTNTFAGGLFIDTGRTLTANSDAALGGAGGLVRLDNNSQFRFSAGFTVDAARPIELPGTIRYFTTLGAFTGVVAANLNGAGQLGVGLGGSTLDSGTIRLTGSNSIAGGVVVAGTTLEVPSDAQLGGMNGTLTIGRNITFNTFSPGKLRALGNLDVAATRTTTFRNATVDTNGFDVTFNQSISGDILTKMGAGVLRLNTVNTFNGSQSVTVQGGTLRLGIDNAIGSDTMSRDVTVNSPGMLDLNGFDLSLSRFNGTGGTSLGDGTLKLRNGFYTYTGGISGTGTVVIQSTNATLPTGGGYVTFDGNNTFEGGLSIVNNGGLLIASSNNLGASVPVTIDNGVLGSSSLAASDVTVTHAISIGAGGAHLRGAFRPLAVEGLITGSGFLRIAGEVRVVNPANNFIGEVRVSGGYQAPGTLMVGSDSALGNVANALHLGGQAVFEGSPVPSVGTLKALGDFTLSASREVRLTADDTSAILAGGVVNTNGHTVTIAGPITEAFAGNSFLKAGLGTLALDGASSYLGYTYVDGGTLLINGSVDSLETRALAGSTLGGVGHAGNVRVNAGANLAPGTSVGTLFTELLTFDAMSKLSLEFASPTSADQLNVGGNVTLTGNVELALSLGYAPVGTNTYTVINNDASDLINTLGFFFIGTNTLTDGESFSAAGADWTIRYTGGTGNDVTLTLKPASQGLAGDYNGNGAVDAADYTVWRNMLGQSGPNLAADGNHDTHVNRMDYDLWQLNYGSPGSGAGNGTTAGIPEPATLSLFTVGLLSLIFGRQQNRKSIQELP